MRAFYDEISNEILIDCNKVPCQMRYRLPLELELTIVEHAAPPLAIDRLHDRVDFFIKTSLVHRSLTAWAQDRLRDQLLYTYRPRPDEHERLKRRVEAGAFSRERPLRRLYLDLSNLPTDIRERTASGTDSVSAFIDGRLYGTLSQASVPSDLEQVGTTVQGEACEPVAHFVQPQDEPLYAGRWGLCAMLTTFCQALDTLWLKLPHIRLDIADLPPPRMLYIDDGAVFDLWGSFALLPLSSETALFLRNIALEMDDGDIGEPQARHLIFDKCWWVEVSAADLLVRFHHLETLVLDVRDNNLVSLITALPTTIRRVHILEHNFEIDEHRSHAPRVLPHLESFTYTLLSSGDSAPQTPEDVGPDRDPLAEVRQAVESILAAPQCTFKYLRSTRSPEDALADAVAELGLDL